MKKIFIIIAFIFLSTNIFAQYGEIDSLEFLLASETVDTTKVNMLNTLAQKLSYSDSDKAHEFVNQSIELCNKIGFDKGLGMAYKHLAIVFFYKGDIDKSLESLNKSLEVYQKMDDQSSVAKVLNNLGIIYKAKGDYEKSLEYYKKTIDVLSQINDKSTLVTAYLNTANIFTLQGNHNKALEYNFNALKITDELDKKDENVIVQQASINMNIAIIYRQQENNVEAENHYNKANKLFQSIKDSKGIADTYLNIGTLKYDEKNYTEAINFYNKSLEFYTNENKIALANYNIGDAYNKQADYEKSITFLNKSLEIYTKVEDPRGVAVCKSGIGEYYFMNENYEQAIISLDSAYQIAMEIGNPKIIEDVTAFLSLAYSKTGQFELAYKTHLVFKQMHDSIFRSENERKQTQIAMQYEFDKEQKTQEIKHEAEKEELKIVILFSLAAVILFILLSIFAYRSYKIKQKANQSLKLKNEEINQQNEEITAQRDEIGLHKKDLEKQHKIVVTHKREIESSIVYAKRIQIAVIPSRQVLDKYFLEYFIFFKPRDVVSGDFYWIGEKNNSSIIVAADCTGHGVPGAFMSMLGISFLNEIINKDKELKANEILDNLRKSVIKSLNQNKEDNNVTKDGMDISIIITNKESNTLQYAGAYNSMYLLRNKTTEIPNLPSKSYKIFEKENCKNHIIEIKADRMPIGVHVGKIKPFTNKEIKLQKDDKIYLFSDGYADQFGGEKNRKYTQKRFKNLLLNINENNLEKQKEILQTTHDDWKGKIKQLDDILVIGLKYN